MVRKNVRKAYKICTIVFLIFLLLETIRLENKINTDPIKDMRHEEKMEPIFNLISNELYKINTQSRSNNTSELIPDLTFLNASEEIIPIVKRNDEDIETKIIQDSEEFYFKFEVINQGSTLGENITIKLYKEFAKEKTELFIYFIAKLEENASQIIITDKILAKYSETNIKHQKIIIEIDPENRVLESDEANNLIEDTASFRIVGAGNDSDYDGYLNIWEETLGTDPLDPKDKPADSDIDGRPDGDESNSELWMDNDDDNDGMPDAWERGYTLDPLNASDALDDPDDDGFSNLNEYLSNTDPLDNEEHPELLTEPEQKAEDWGRFVIFLIFIVIIVMIISIIIGMIIIEKRKRDEEFWTETFGDTAQSSVRGRDNGYKQKDKYNTWVRQIEKGQSRGKMPKDKYKLEFIGGPPDEHEKEYVKIIGTPGTSESKKKALQDPRLKGTLCLWCDGGITRKYIKRCTSKRTSHQRCPDGPFCSRKCLNSHLKSVPHYQEVDF